MVVYVEFDGRWVLIDGPVSVTDIKNEVLRNCKPCDPYITYNGKIPTDDAIINKGVVHVASRLLGGKGGFGSMLRAIGAQIEKTTNREACRDLSGRRLRDINEEKRLKNWIAQQAEREREAAERRKKKLERLCLEPKHDFEDQNYEKERTDLTEKVYDAVEQGFRSAGTSSTGSKRKSEPQGSSQSKKKKTCLWVDDIDEDDLSSVDSDADSEIQGLSEKKSDITDEQYSSEERAELYHSKMENCETDPKLHFHSSSPEKNSNGAITVEARSLASEDNSDGITAKDIAETSLIVNISQ